MTKLNDDLKKILAGLALQNAGEYLPLSTKKNLLGVGAKSEPHSNKQPSLAKQASHRVALLTDGKGVGAALDYALESCSKQGAKIDLLVHNHAIKSDISAIQERAKASNLDCHVITLGLSPVEDICSYIINHPSLIFLVSTPADKSANELIRDVIPNQKSRIYVPLVLIEDKSPELTEKQTAA
ncbi:MAG: hypothetical protein ABW104_10630 [Candidatus Thiodiazotropha sp. 6PLUC2]